MIRVDVVNGHGAAIRLNGRDRQISHPDRLFNQRPGARIFSQYVPRLIVHEERRSNIAGFLDQLSERIAGIVGRAARGCAADSAALVERKGVAPVACCITRRIIELS